MKTFLIALALVALACTAGLLLGMAGKALFTGESFPHPIPKTTTITVPFSLP